MAYGSNYMTYNELRKYVVRSGVRIIAATRITEDDRCWVDVKKGTFLAYIDEVIAEGNGNIETNTIVNQDGNIVID